MSAKVKPGSVVMVDGARYVVLDKAPAKVRTRYDYPDPNGRPVRRTATPRELVESMLSERGRIAALAPQVGGWEDAADSRGTGQRWWVQDAKTGVPLTWAVRESRMSVAHDDELTLEGVA